MGRPQTERQLLKQQVSLEQSAAIQVAGNVFHFLEVTTAHTGKSFVALKVHTDAVFTTLVDADGNDVRKDLRLGITGSETLTLTGQPLNTETVVIGSKTYTFQTTLTDVDGNVLIGATASDSLDNLIAAINLSAGAGTLYAASMTANTDVTAVAGAGDTMDVTSINVGTAVNSVATTETLTNGSWGNATLQGGNDFTIKAGTLIFSDTKALITDVTMSTGEALGLFDR